MACICHGDACGRVSVFVDGARLMTLGEGAAPHAALVCASSRTEATALAQALAESAEFRALVKQLLQMDVLWAEL